MKFMHMALIVSDLKRAEDFYESILGLTKIARPDLGFDGLWYGLDGGSELHLMLLENPYVSCDKPEHGGRDNHIALQSHEFDHIRQRLDSVVVPYTMSRSGRNALFFRDPDGNTIELIQQ